MKSNNENDAKLSTDFNTKSLNLIAPALVLVAALSIMGIVYITTTEVKTSMVFSLVGVIALLLLAVFSIINYHQLKLNEQHLSHMEKLNADHLSYLENQNKRQTEVLLEISGKLEKLDPDTKEHNSE